MSRFREIETTQLEEMRDAIADRIRYRELNEEAPDWMFQQLGYLTVELWSRKRDEREV